MSAGESTMTELIDLSLPIPPVDLERTGLGDPIAEKQTVRTREWDLRSRGLPYSARVHYFEYWSMAGTYLDFPGHILQTDDGTDAANAPLPSLYRLDATVIHLDRESGSGKIKQDELAAACAAPVADLGRALILNALGSRRFDEIEERSVYLGRDAIEWIVGTGVSILVSDVYESSTDPQGVFPALFENGVSTVCCPVNLHGLHRPRVKLTVLPLRFAGVTQLPCRVVAEQEVQ